MLSKPISEIKSKDIADLCARGGAYESGTLEFKRELPGRDGRPDPWMSGGEFSSYARDRLFREIVAFANSQGGTLVLGIEETEDRPARARAISPIPRVHELAARLEEAARACIEPSLPSLLIRGVVTKRSGVGIVVFRTVRSPFGPHRVASDGHAFIRRGASSVKMTMREIQDLTLDLARGADRLEMQLASRHKAFTEWFHHLRPGEKGGLRVTAVPIGDLPLIGRVAEPPNRIPLKTRFVARLGDSSPVAIDTPAPHRTRPIVRGLRYYSAFDDRGLQLDVFDSGLVDFWFWHSAGSST